MRLAVISPWGSPCGISVYSADVFGELQRRGHTVHVVASEDALPAATPAGISHSRVWRQGQSPSWRVVAELHRFRPDVIHVQHEMGFFSPLAVWRDWRDCLQSCSVPLVVTYHSVPDAATSLTDLPVAAAVVCSPVAKCILESRVSFPVFGIEHGVDGPLPDRRDPEPNSLVTFGFLAGCKGYERILQAMAALRPELPDLTLTILGSLTSRALSAQMDYFQRLHQQVLQLGLSGQVDISCGFRTLPEIRSILSRKAVGVLHYDRTDRLSVSELREGPVADQTSPAAPTMPLTEWGTSGAGPLLPRMVSGSGLGTSGPGELESAVLHEVPLETSGVRDEVVMVGQGDAVVPGRAGVRCQSAAIFRMWSAGVPCIVSMAQHFDLGAQLRPAQIRAEGVRSLTDQIRRLCTDRDAYAAACETLRSRVTRTWHDVADDHERVYAAVAPTAV